MGNPKKIVRALGTATLTLALGLGGATAAQAGQAAASKPPANTAAIPNGTAVQGQPGKVWQNGKPVDAPTAGAQQAAPAKPAAPAPAQPAPAAPAVHSGAQQLAENVVAQINKYRAEQKLKPLAVDSALGKGAQQWAMKLAQGQKLGQNPDIPRSLGKHKAWGENIGTGSDAAQIVEAWKKNDQLNRNMLNPSLSTLAVGTHTADGKAYFVVADFAGY